MKRLNLISAALTAWITLCTAGFAQKKEAPGVAPAKPLNLAIVIYEGVELLDFSGPMDVFVRANNMAPNSYNIYTVGIEEGLIATQEGAATIKPRYTIRNCPKPDVLIIPGAAPKTISELSANQAFIEWLRQQANDSQLVMSVCTGAFLLGKTNLLDGRKATTHWFVLDTFQKEFPKTTAMQGVRFVEDGKFVTAAGISSGIDGALHVVEKTTSKQDADLVARAMQYRRDTPAYPEQPPGKVASSRSSQTALDSNKTGAGRLTSEVDPVCGMRVDPQTKFTYERQGHTYGFCSEHCRRQFADRPAKSK